MREESTHIVLLGSKWDDQAGVAVIIGSEPTRQIRNLGVISANPEMAMATMVKLLSVMRDRYTKHPNLRDDLKPAAAKLAQAVTLLEEVDVIFHPHRAPAGKH